MSGVRVLVGTKKGAFILTSDGKREKLGRQRPAFCRLGDLSPERFACRSGSPFCVADRAAGLGNSPAFRATAAKRGKLPAVKKCRRLAADRRGARATSLCMTLRLKPASLSPRINGMTARSTLGNSSECGILNLRSLILTLFTPASKTPRLFRSTDGAKSWQELSGLRGHGTGPKWQPGAGGMCLHTIVLDPSNPDRIYHRDFRSGSVSHRRRRQDLEADQSGSAFAISSRPNAEVGHCVHHVAMNPSRPDVLFMQKHWDVMRSDNAGDLWTEVSGNLPTDFGFAIDVHAHEPETVYVVPIKSDSEHFPLEGKLRVYRSRTGGNEWEPLTKGLPQSDCYVNVLRDAMAVDSLDSCGVYFGTTGGQVYASADSGDTWAPIVRDLPAVLSVEVQTLP